PGIYRYNPDNHSIELIKKGDFRIALCEAALGQLCVEEAPVTIIFTGDFEKVTCRYGKRSFAYVYQESGHAAQNAYLQAVSLQLGTVVIGAFNDESVKKILGLDGGEVPLYLMPVGKI
ncbi:MAG: SagB/ThcOx family dehydrogenase, partial [Candidatus Eremiobacteraeota bacterium]|nr:SagB/ThcOx family dehydrogenase [Candidatus Eremiobacteraeota bacterium]